MRDYMTNLGTVMILITVFKMLLPEGNVKKFASFAMGFMLICTVISPLPNLARSVEKNMGNIGFDEEKIKNDEALYRAEVLKKHRENLNALIEKETVHGSKAYTEVSEDGEITSVTLRLKGDESRAVYYITETLGVKRERIKLIYDNN